MAEHLLDELINSLRVLPGVGPKSAQRMAYQLLQRNRDGGIRLADMLRLAMEKIGECRVCRNFTEAEVCRICSDSSREHGKLLSLIHI